MRKCYKSGRGEHGGSLVELLVGLAISITVIGVSMSLLIGGMGVTGRVRQQTDQYESLRLAASLFQQDARLAYSAGVLCNSTRIWLYAAPSASQVVEYTLDAQPGNVVYDLHRRLWVNGDPLSGGTMVNDYVVAQGIDQPTQSGFDVFGCDKSSTYPQGRVEINLEKPLLSGQSSYTSVQAVAFPRNK